MSNPATMALDWSNLLPELLQLIGKKITFLSDFIRFGAVCRPWQTAYSLLRGHHLPLQLPWLMLPYQSDGNGNGTRLFYDLSSSKIHKLKLPQTCGVNVSICGSGHGWFVLQKGERGHEVSLLNPITRTTISLPKFRGNAHDLVLAPIDADKMDFFFNFFVDNDFCSIQPHHPVNIYKAILTSSPGDPDPSCRVFVSTYSVWLLAFCNIGDEFWTVIEYNPEYLSRWGIGEEIYDISYSNGFLYTIGHLGTVTRYDIEDGTRTLLGGSIEGEGMHHLVQGVSGDILLIEGIPTYVNEYWNETNHIVYKLSNDDENGEYEWIQVSDVGQNVLFVGMGRPPHAFSLSSANLQLPEWGANCFYFWEREQEGRIIWRNHIIKMERLDDGTVTDITGDLGLYELSRHLQSSLWLTPSML